MKFNLHKSAINLSLISLLIISVAGILFGQNTKDAKSAKGAVLKGKAPLSTKTLEVKIPKPQEFVLPNGLRVVLLENHKIPTFSLQMVILNGGLSDPEENRGLSSFTATLLNEGTTSRSGKAIAEQIESLGATLNASSSLNSFTSSINSLGLIENLDGTFDLFADVIRNPLFPEESIEKFKSRSLAQLQFQRSVPQLLAYEQFNKAIYGGHPLGQILPAPESIKNLTSERLKNFHQTYYRPNNAILAVVGDITMQKLLPKVEKAFGTWNKASIPVTKFDQKVSVKKAEISLIDRPGSVQTVLQLGNLSIERTNSDYFALVVMNQILGGSTSARLFMNLREDKGYTYGAYSNFVSAKYPGMIWASAEVRTEVTDGALKEFLAEINKIRDESVSLSELENAKGGLIGNFALSLEQPHTLISNIVNQKLYDLPDNYWDLYPQNINAVTTDDIHRVAQKYLDINSLQIVAVGDGAKIREVLSKYGTVKQYNTDGKLVTANPNN